MKLRLLFAMLVILVLTGCLKNRMTITFDLPKEVNTTCRIVYYASAKKGGMAREDFVPVNAGKGEMQLPQGNPSLMYLFSSTGKTPSALIYAERGDKILVTGKGNDPMGWEIKGNKITEALTEWRIKNKAALAGGDEEKINKAVAAYVRQNPGSEAAAIILYAYFMRRGHEDEFAALDAKLDKKLIGNKKLMGALSGADLLTGSVEAPKYPSEIILTGSEGYADTLKLGSGNSTMLVFRSASNRGEDIPKDSLKRMIAARGGKTVAELYMETDSLNWRRHVDNDSIQGMKRLWMPLGMADSLSITMAVRRAPYYILFDSKGKVLYRGDNFSDASSKFESATP